MDFQKAFDAGFDAIKGYVDRSLATAYARIKALEAREPLRGEKGDPGERGQSGKDGRDGVGLADIVRDAEGNLIAVMSDGRTKAIGNIAVRDGADGKDGEPGRDGKDGERGEKGADGLNGKDGAPGRDGADGKDGRDGTDGRDGVDGKDGLNGKDAPAPTQEHIVEAILTMPEIIDEAVRRYLTDNPPAAGKDGKDGERGVDGKDGVDGRDGLNGKDGADGIGLAAAVQDADGNLVITDTKGGVHKLGSIRGQDGRDGIDGVNGKNGADGLAGKDGRDGFSLEHFDAELMEDGRTVLLSFAAKDTTYKVELGIPAMIYRGVWKDGQSYERGDVVTFGGSTFHCNEDTSDKPEVSKTWQLMVKRGRDGKDGSPGEKGERGIEGKPGRDLTQLGLDGAKW